MSSEPDYSTEGARAAAERDELVDWVVDFLGSPDSDNAALAASLRQEGLTWAGPIRVADRRVASDSPDLRTIRFCNPSMTTSGATMSMSWRATSRREPEPPPVIVTFRDDQLVLEDGNHRVEAIRRAGRDDAWAVIGFEDIGGMRALHRPERAFRRVLTGVMSRTGSVRRRGSRAATGAADECLAQRGAVP